MLRIQRCYNLQAINGVLLPAGDVLAGWFVFFNNGTYASSATYEPVQPLPDVGTYELEDTGALMLYGPDGETPFAAGVLNADALVVSAGTYVFTATRSDSLS